MFWEQIGSCKYSASAKWVHYCVWLPLPIKGLTQHSGIVCSAVMLYQHFVVHTASVLTVNTRTVTQCQVKRVAKNQDTGSFLLSRDENVKRVPSQFQFIHLDPNDIYCLLFLSLPVAQQQQVCQCCSLLMLHDHIQSDTPHTVVLLWTSDQPEVETSTWQHTTNTTEICMPPAGFEPAFTAS